MGKRKEYYKIRSLRLSDEVWEKLKKLKENDGATMNLILKKSLKLYETYKPNTKIQSENEAESDFGRGTSFGSLTK